MDGEHANEGHQEGIREGEESVEDLARHQGGHVETQAGGQHHEDGRGDDGAGHEEDGQQEDQGRGHSDHVLRHLEGELAALAENDGNEVWLTVAVTVVAVTVVTVVTMTVY